jgi:hypothetical protein
MRVLGVDPGLHGALAILDGRDIVQFCAMPLREGKIDAQALHSIVGQEELDLIVLEDAHSRPGEGVKSTFTSGLGYGRVMTILELMGVPMERPTPQKWQSTIARITGLSGGDDPKVRALAQARALWPRQDFVLPGCRKQHDGVVDACLMAASRSLPVEAWKVSAGVLTKSRNCGDEVLVQAVGRMTQFMR